nr:hypothetical protein [Rahnella aceris]
MTTDTGEVLPSTMEMGYTGR